MRPQILKSAIINWIRKRLIQVFIIKDQREAYWYFRYQEFGINWTNQLYLEFFVGIEFEYSTPGIINERTNIDNFDCRVQIDSVQYDKSYYTNMLVQWLEQTDSMVSTNHFLLRPDIDYVGVMSDPQGVSWGMHNVINWIWILQKIQVYSSI